MLFSWQWKLGAGLALVALLSFGALHIYNKGKAVGNQEGQATQLQVQDKLLQAQEQRWAAVVQVLQKSLDDNKLALDASRSAIVEQSRVIASIQAQRGQAATAISTFTPSEHRANIERQLGGEYNSDPVIIKVDQIVTDYPLLTKELTQTQKTVVKQEESLKLLDDRVAIIERQRDTVLEGYNVLKGAYVQAYNAAMAPKRKWYCFWICKKADTIPLPAPVTFEGKPGS